MIYCTKKKKHTPLVVVLTLLLLVGLFAPMSGPNMTTDVHAAAMTITVDFEKNTSYNPKAGSGNVYARWEILSTTAYMDDAKGRKVHCVQPSKTANETTKTYTIDKDYADDGTGKFAIIRKLLYYSYGYGMFDKKGKKIYEDLDLLGNDNGLCATHVALSVKYGDDPNPYLGAENWKANGKIEELINRISQLDPPPDSFRVFIIQQQGYQDMMGAYYHKVPGELKVQKSSADRSITDGNSCYSLKGAQYGVYTDKNCTTLAKDINGKTIILTTNENGITETATLDPGTYYVKEIKASPGYLLDKDIHSRTFDSGGGATFAVKEQPGGDPLTMLVQKKDSETASGEAHKGFTLEGAIFRVTYYPGYFDTEDAAKASGLKATEWKFKTDAKGWARFGDPWKVEGPDFWKPNGNPQLPYGTAFIQEIQAPDGYTVNGQVHVRKIYPNNPGQPATGNPVEVKEDIIRTDMSFIKVETDSMKRMAYIPFRLTNNATGESHVVVTNKNGQFDTKSYRDGTPNANDACFEGKKVIKDKEKDINFQTPVWFGEGTYDAKKGALIPGEYTLSELSCDANKGHDLVKDITFTVDDAHVNINLGTITNNPIDIQTTAADAKTGKPIGMADKEVTIIDKVSYTNLVVGKEYTVKGVLMNQKTGTEYLVNGKPVTAEKTFVPWQKSGIVNLEYTFDGSGLAGQTIVVFEDLYYEGEKIVSHADINDEEQTVHYPKIKTKAMALKNEGKIKDQVTYENLIPGKKYELRATVYCQTEDKILYNVKGETTFTPKNASGVEDVFLDTKEIKGRTVTVYEELWCEGKLVAEHKDKTDKDQTVSPPPQTGDESTPINPVPAIIIMLVALMSMAAAWKFKGKAKKSEK